MKIRIFSICAATVFVLTLMIGGEPLHAAETRKLNGVENPRDAVDRLHDRITKMTFEMTGRGSCSRWCVKGVANFKYQVLIEAESKILEKTKLSRGRYRVVELHKIIKSCDMLHVSEADLVTNFSDLDSSNFNKVFNASCAVIAVLGLPKVAGGMVVGKAALGKVSELYLQPFDGISIKAVFKQFGVSPELIDNQILDKFTQAFRAKIRKIEGKSYKVTYTVDRNNQPISMSYTYADGTEVTDEEEKLVLEKVNVFIDTHTVPNRRYRPGSEWTVNAEDLQQVMDPYVDGHYTGDIVVKREDDDVDGTWNIRMKPAALRIVDDKSDDTTGQIQLIGGSGKVDRKRCTIDEIKVHGTAKLKRVTRHHWLFQSQISGWCTFSGRLHSIPLQSE